jgi:hypothetical protein
MKGLKSMPAVHRWVAFAVVLASAGCSSLLGSEAGLAAPKDPGTIVVSVRDSGGNPIANVEVQVHDIPNSVGSTFSIGRWTDGNGVAELTYIPAGKRRVEVKPSPGFRAAADSLIQAIDVVKSSSVGVAFVLERL